VELHGFDSAADPGAPEPTVKLYLCQFRHGRIRPQCVAEA
jgi:hypothetical protein